MRVLVKSSSTFTSTVPKSERVGLSSEDDEDDDVDAAVDGSAVTFSLLADSNDDDDDDDDENNKPSTSISLVDFSSLSFFSSTLTSFKLNTSE